MAQLITNWRSAEQFAASQMRRWGFSDAQVTSGGADGGLDVIARGAVAQVKFEAAKVGRPALQRLVGASHRTERARYFFSRAGYSKAAITYANECGIVLCQYDTAGRLLVVGRHHPPMVVGRALAGLSPREFLDAVSGPGAASVTVILVGIVGMLAGLPDMARAFWGWPTADEIRGVFSWLMAVCLFGGGVLLWLREPAEGSQRA